VIDRLDAGTVEDAVVEVDEGEILDLLVRGVSINYQVMGGQQGRAQLT
jgi:sporulation protein YlmC with PRC-barrel domain